MSPLLTVWVCGSGGISMQIYSRVSSERFLMEDEVVSEASMTFPVNAFQWCL